MNIYKVDRFLMVDGFHQPINETIQFIDSLNLSSIN